MIYLWDYLLAIRLRLDKGRLNPNQTGYSPEGFLEFLECAEVDVANLLALIAELREQRNNAYQGNPCFTPAGIDLAIQNSDRALQNLISLKNETIQGTR